MRFILRVHDLDLSNVTLLSIVDCDYGGGA